MIYIAHPYITHVLSQVQLLREGRSHYIHPSAEDRPVSDQTAQCYGQIQHGHSSGGQHGGQQEITGYVCVCVLWL